MKRRVIGTIKNLQDLPSIGSTVTFTLLPGSYTSEVFYPKESIVVKTNDLGFFSTDLWCNESGIIPSTYYCSIDNNEIFMFTLPVGTGDISLNNLRSLGIAPFPIPEKPQIRDYRELFIPTPNQIIFSLQNYPNRSDLTLAWLNGVKITYGVDYLLDGLFFTWLNSLFLEETDILEILYFVDI